MRSKATLLAASVAFVIGVVVGAVVTAVVTGDERRDTPITRTELVEAFQNEEIELARQFSSSTGLVDASYTISSDSSPHKSPLVVELLRTIAAAEVRERFLVEKAPQEEMEVTVLRGQNVVAVLFGRNAGLLRRVETVIQGLEQ